MKDHIFRFCIIVFCITPAHSWAQSNEKLRSSVSLQSEYVFVNNLSDWSLNQAFYGYEADSVTWIGRLMHAYRFQENEIFLSAVAYPQFSDNMYAYLMVGTSPVNAEIYPAFRASAKLFKNVTDWLVVGPGIQYIRTTSDNVYIYGITANWYVGTILLIGNPSVRFLKGETSFTVIGSARKYFDGTNSFINVTVGSGQNPENTLFTDELQDAFTKFFVSSRLQYLFTKKWVLNAGVKIRKDTYSSGTERFQTGIHVGLTFKF